MIAPCRQLAASQVRNQIPTDGPEACSAQRLANGRMVGCELLAAKYPSDVDTEAN